MTYQGLLETIIWQRSKLWYGNNRPYEYIRRIYKMSNPQPSSKNRKGKVYERSSETKC